MSRKSTILTNILIKIKEILLRFIIGNDTVIANVHSLEEKIILIGNDRKIIINLECTSCNFLGSLMIIEQIYNHSITHPNFKKLALKNPEVQEEYERLKKLTREELILENLEK